MHPELVEGRTFWADPDRLGGGPRNTHLDATGAKILRITPEGRSGERLEREIGEAASAPGDSEKTSTTSVRWERLPS